MQTLGDLEIGIERIRNKAALVDRTLQPFPAVVKNTATGSPQSYVVIDTLRYTADTPLKAVDTCFKIYHALHAEYPIQSEVVWLLLQKGVYDIDTEWDKNTAKLKNLVSDIKALFRV